MKHELGFKAAVAWFFALLLLFPGIATHWTFLSFGATLKPAALSAPAVFYVLFGIGVLLAYIWWCKCRRLVFGIFLLVLWALHVYTKVPTLYRILTFATYAVVVGILVEFVRQNMPLYRHLKASSARFIPMLRRTLLLWSPALLFIAFGIFLNHLIVEWTTDALYKTRLIDEYCAISTKPDWPPLPCTRSANWLGSESFTPTLSDDKIAIPIATYIDDLFLVRQEQVIAGLSRVEAEASDPDLEALKALLDPVPLFGLEEYFKELQEQQRQQRLKLSETQKKLQREIQKTEKSLKKTEAKLRETSHRLKHPLRYALWYPKTPQQHRQLSHQRWRQVKHVAMLKDELGRLGGETNSVHYVRADLCVELTETLDESFESLAQKTGEGAEGIRRSAALRDDLIRITSELRTQTTEILKEAIKQKQEIPFQFDSERPFGLLEKSAGKEEEESISESRGNEPEQTWMLRPLSVMESVQHTLDRWLETRESELQEGLDQLRSRSEGDAATIAAYHQKLWDGLDPFERPLVPKSLNLDQEDCGLFDVGCRLLNYTKKKVEVSYSNKRKAMQKRAIEKVNESVEKGEQSADELVDDLQADLRTGLEDAQGYFDASLSKVVKGGIIASALLKLFLALAIIKSLFYVLATEVFHNQGLSSIGLEGETTSEGKYQLSTHLEIPRDMTIPLITSTVGVNQGQETIIPQPTSGLFSRILRSKWLLNRGTHAGTASMRFTQPGGRIGVDWEMQEGEEVVFNYRDLLGFSENVELRSTISLQLASLLLGKHLYHSARCVGGPGRLLLSVSGQVEDHQEEVQTFPLERLIAWNRHAKFSISDKRTFGAVFKDGFTVGREGEGKAGSGLLVVGAPTVKPPLLHGTIRFVKTFLMPF
jgi:hypothetical protein